MPSEAGLDDQIPKSWIKLEDRLYRHDYVYSSLKWTLQSAQLAAAIVAVAPSAGPVAIIPDAGWGLSYALAVYSTAGRIIARFDRLRERTVPLFRAVALGWSTDDMLTVVYNDGVFVRLMPDLQLANARVIRAFKSDENERVHDAVVLTTGDIVMRTASGKITLVDPLDTIRADSTVVPPPEADIHGVASCGIVAVKSDNTQDLTRHTLFIGENGNITTSNSDSFTLNCDEKVSHLALSANGSYVAALDSSSAVLFVSTVDLRSQIAHVDLAVELSILGVENMYSDIVFNAKAPESIAWIGSDAVAILYKEHLVLVGPHGSVSFIALDEHCAKGGVVLFTEIDGLRLISSVNVQFVQMVPESVTIVRSEKQAPGFKLLLSSSYKSNESKARHNDALTRYQLLRQLRDSDELIVGARSCVAAALLETDIPLQKRMLQAAGYGIRYATVYHESDDYGDLSSKVSGASRKEVENARRDTTMIPAAIAILRVLNAVSLQSSGIPLTKPQFDRFGLISLVARLSRYGEHTLALRLAFFGGIPVYDVLAEWAAATIRRNSGDTDEALTVLIADRFDTVKRSLRMPETPAGRKGRVLPYVRAAEAAFIIGRPKCAELLLQRESRPASKVAMYLRMNREAPAVRAAVESGDPELVLDALSTILEKKRVRETARLLRSMPSPFGTRATDLLAAHLRQIGNQDALRLLFAETGRLREATLVEIGMIHDIKDTSTYLSALEKAAASISRGPGHKACQFEIQALQHAVTVASCAREVEKLGHLEHGTLRHASDGDLLARAIVDIQDKTKRRDMLARLRRELHVPDRRFFWDCLESMAEVGDFESIEALSYSAGSGRAPPIGLIPFVDTCIKYQMEEEAIKYALRIGDLRDRARALARCGRGREAADIASRLRNQQLLSEVQELAARHVANMNKRREEKSTDPYKALART